MSRILKFVFSLFCLLIVNNCATTSSAFLGPIFTGAKTGSIYQASLSYSTGKIINELNPYITRNKINNQNTFKRNILLPDIPYSDKNPIILTSYKIELINFSEIIEPEPLP